MPASLLLRFLFGGFLLGSLGSGFPGPLRLDDGLQLGRGLEARVVHVPLVVVVVRLGLQVGGQRLEHALQDAVDGLFPGRVAVPDGDEVRVEARREADAADLVAWSGWGGAVSKKESKQAKWDMMQGGGNKK